MQRKEYGQLLFNAIRETMEIMAFAEIVPYSMKIGKTELLDPDELQATNPVSPMPSAQQDDGWGTSSDVVSEADAWGDATASQPLMSASSETWGTGASPVTNQMWANPLDAWEDNVPPAIPPFAQNDTTQQIDFDQLIREQEDWCWSCLKVNSPELDAIWLIVSKQLAQELSRTMYAGEEMHLDSPTLRDIIAELTNVLGGRLMLLLEDWGGKFTLEVPVTGTGMPELPKNDNNLTVTYKIFVDGTYPVISVMSFKATEPETSSLQAVQTGTKAMR